MPIKKEEKVMGARTLMLHVDNQESYGWWSYLN